MLTHKNVNLVMNHCEVFSCVGFPHFFGDIPRVSLGFIIGVLFPESASLFGIFLV